MNIEVDESNIKSFDRVARKYHIDYTVKKDKTLDPPKYFVFVKGRDQDAMTMAFKEFIACNNRKKERTPFKQVLKKSRDIEGSGTGVKLRDRLWEFMRDWGSHPAAPVFSEEMDDERL